MGIIGRLVYGGWLFISKELFMNRTISGNKLSSSLFIRKDEVIVKPADFKIEEKNPKNNIIINPNDIITNTNMRKLTEEFNASVRFNKKRQPYYMQFKKNGDKTDTKLLDELITREYAKLIASK